MSMPIDIILDANIPKKVKNMNNGRRVLHIGDVDTTMEDDDILHLASKFDCLVVTHDRELAYKASKKMKILFIKENVPASDIIGCINKNGNLLKTASIFCENGRKCKNC
ncbi:MAG: DUF5615 family PIN-like protein [Candidatus Hydrothermarchaeales archaeon]